MAQTLLDTETTERKKVSVPLGAIPATDTTITLTFTLDEWNAIRQAVSNEASSWRVVRSNKDTKEAYSKVDAKRAKKGFGPRQREYVGNYIYTGGKAKAHKARLGAMGVVKVYTQLVLIAEKIREASKLA